MPPRSSKPAAAFVGIHNENEFYSHHYLSEIFSRDIGETIEAWRKDAADEDKPPYERLRALAGEYRRRRADYQRERRPESRLKLQRDWLRKVLYPLGHGWHPGDHLLDDGNPLPALGADGFQDGVRDGWAQLFVLDALDTEGEGDDPLTLHPHPTQFDGEAPPPKELLDATWNDVVTRGVFGRDYPPRWVLLLTFDRILLIERGKWTHNRLLRFDLDEILGRGEDATLKATAALLHRDSLLPPDGQSLLDRLDENSHKHAFAVSEDLKYALREAIEAIGNEAIRYLREVSKDKVYDLDDELAGELGLECLRYMYRLLFLFYIEARPDLGYAPMNADAYRMGYSLERLRDLEMVPLHSEEALDGFYLHDSIQLLFRLIRDGFEGESGKLRYGQDAFHIRKLDSALFREGATPLLDKVKLRNRVLQPVIRLMSLSRPARGRRGRRGRISYAQLGINQLGAVYEALLSYRGFFAEEDLYEVKKAKDDPDDLKNAWFVPARDLDQYDEAERVYDRDEHGRKTLRVHRQGRFIYRLAGRDRQKSASYYTPESLTRCVVKYSLKELIPSDLPAERILDLTICEPAMGSAAFLNEAVNQLAERLPGTAATRAQAAHPPRGLRRRAAEGAALHRRPERVRRGPEPGGGGARGDLAVAELHPPGRPRSVVRVPARRRELADRSAPAGVSGGPAAGGAEGGPLVRRGPGAGSASAEPEDAAPGGVGLSLPAPGPGDGRVSEQGREGAGAGALRAARPLAEGVRPGVRRGGDRGTGVPVGSGRQALGRCTRSSSARTTGRRRIRWACGAVTAFRAGQRLPMRGRTGSAPREC